MQAFISRGHGDHEQKVHRPDVRGTPIHAVAQRQGRNTGGRYPGVAGVGQRDAVPDGRGAAEVFPLADSVIVGRAIGDGAGLLLQFYQDAQHVGGLFDVGVQAHACGVHQFAYFHRTAPFAQMASGFCCPVDQCVQVLTYRALGAGAGGHLVGSGLDLGGCIGNGHSVACGAHQFKIVIVITDDDGVFDGFVHQCAKVLQAGGLADAAGHDL